MAQNDKKNHKGGKNMEVDPEVVYTRFRNPADQKHVEEQGNVYGGRPEYVRELVRRDRIAKEQRKR